MLRRIFLNLALGLAASCAIAQTAPSPADVGISKGTPDIFKLKGNDNVWTPFGSVDPSTHIFIPGTNGNIAPNDCVKWGPGLTSAGAACNSVTGGAHPANQLTIYTNHAGLLANVTTPTEAWTVVQQGFYAPGDGGSAVYQWNLTSYCEGGTSSAPRTADGIACVLPAGQGPSTAGRYLLSTSDSLDVRQVGMQPGGQDNSPYVQTLMNVISPAAGTFTAMTVVFPPVIGRAQTNYYFTQPLVISRGIKLSCATSGFSYGGSSLVFAPGVDGVIQEMGYLTADQGWGGSDITGCGIGSLGNGVQALGTKGSANLTDVHLNGYLSTGEWTFPASCGAAPGDHECHVGVGDGIVVVRYGASDGRLSIAPGAYVTAANFAAATATLSTPVLNNLVFTTDHITIYDLPVSQKYTAQTTTGSDTITVTGGPRILRPGDMIWSDAFLFGTSVLANANAITGTPTVHTGGSGYTGTSGTMTWNGPGCAGGYNAPPVLNVTAAAGVITGVTSVANAGDCLQSTPLSSATSWTPGGGLSGGSGASFNMTFNQTATLYNVTLYQTAPAVGSSGTHSLWTLPKGVTRRMHGSTHKNAIQQFPVGLDLVCQSSTTPPTGCNTSFDEQDSIVGGLIGRLVRGNNSGVSTSIGNQFAANALSDIVEAGTIGSSYFSDTTVSPDNSYSIFAVQVLCGAQNFSNFIGGYLAGQSQGPCLGDDAQGNTNIGVPASIGQPSELFIGSTYGYSNMLAAHFAASNWNFSGFVNSTKTASVATASGNLIALEPNPSYFVGMGVTDVTNPVIPDGTTVTNLTPTSITISSPLTGAIQIGDKIQFTSSQGSPCINLQPGQADSNSGISLDVSCGGGGLNMFYNGVIGGWGINQMFMPDSNYAGYKDLGRVPVFEAGFQLGGESYVGQERQINSSTGPSSDPSHLQGDTTINRAPIPGGVLAWTDTSIFSTTLAAVVTGGTTTSVAVAACPSPALPAGTPIVDMNENTGPSNVRLTHPLGTLSGCAGTTLTLQAAATHSGLNGDAIQFLQWRPAAKIANDATGFNWPVGALTNIANLLTYAPCNGNAAVGLGAIYDGQTVAAAGYNAAVGGGGGSTTRLVFCDGTSWTYH